MVSLALRVEKKLRQADFFLTLARGRPISPPMDQYFLRVAPPPLDEQECYLSAALGAVQSAFYAMDGEERDQAARKAWRDAERAWRLELPERERALFNRIVRLRDDDVHVGDIGARAETRWSQAPSPFFASPPDGFAVTMTNPDGSTVTATALVAAPALYFDHDGKRVDMGKACEWFAHRVRSLFERLP